MQIVREVEQKVKRYIAERIPALDGRPVVMAASGGGDSSAMVAILCEAGVIQATSSVIAHFDHRLRSRDEARADREAVRLLACRYGIDMEVGAWPHPRRSEAAAREARYHFLGAVAHNRAIDAVATGHTADDQAETVLMHAMRGARLYGLAGMDADRRWPLGGPMRLMRPVLRLTRAETRAYCAERDIAFRDDATNDDPAFLRNRVRQHLFRASRDLRDALIAVSEGARDAVRHIERVLDPMVLEHPDGTVRLPRPALAEAGDLVTPYAFRLAVARLFGDAREFERRHYAIMAAAVHATTGSRFELPRGLVVTVDPGEILLSRGALCPELVPAGIEVPLPYWGRLGAWWLTVHPASHADTRSVLLPAGVVVRARRPGDRLRPRGLGGRKKLQDYYVDLKVPRRDRDAAPVIARDDEVLWTPFGPLAPAQDASTPYTVIASRDRLDPPGQIRYDFARTGKS